VAPGADGAAAGIDEGGIVDGEYTAAVERIAVGYIRRGEEAEKKYGEEFYFYRVTLLNLSRGVGLALSKIRGAVSIAVFRRWQTLKPHLSRLLAISLHCWLVGWTHDETRTNRG
jgi:hypothetical protein